jgi:hypothetical protein
MLETYSALWRIEFRTDASKADALAVPLGYLRESSVAGDGRFLGLIFRPSLTILELDRINLATWPELAEERLEQFMNELFESAWVDVSAANDGSHGTSIIAQKYSGYSAFSFVATNAKELKAENWNRLQLKLHASLFEFENALAPSLSAQILPFDRQDYRENANELPASEIMLKAA